MRKAVVILSILTAAFGASTVYLARELYQRDSLDAVTAATGMEAARSFTTASAHSAKGEGKAVGQAGIQTSTALPAGSDASRPAGVASPTDSVKRAIQNEAVAGYARQLLARLDDVNQRPIVLEEQRTVVRRQYEKLKERLHLSDTAFDQFTTLLAEELLQAQESWARCAADPSCDPKKPGNPPVDHTAEYQAMLGTEGADALAKYRSSITERDTVAQLRGRLPDKNFLPEAQAEKLIAALAEERELYSKEVASRGANMTGWGTNLGMLWYTEDSGQPEQYVAEATQFSQRLRSRAAGILNPTQLAAYAQMQDELLAMFAANKGPPARQNKSSVTRAS